MNLVHTGRDKLQQILKEYNSEDVFNLDQSGLFFQLGPNYTLATSRVNGTKKSKDHITVALASNTITVALASNTTGTIKLKPFVITKVKQPKCFGKTYNTETYV